MRNEDLIREVNILEKEVQNMTRVTKVEFLRLIGNFKKRLEESENRFDIPKCLMKGEAIWKETAKTVSEEQ